MNAAAKKWVKALRSGKYKQTTSRLKDKTGYCCLGVACELAVKAGVIKKFEPGNSFLPVQVRNWLGLSSRRGAYRDGDYFNRNNSLDQLNDYRNSFKYIARLIERQPKGLFKE